MTGKPRAQQARRRASAAVPRAAGGTKQHIAEHLGVSTDTVRRDLGPLRPRARRNAVIHKRAQRQARAALAQAHRGGYVRFNTSARARTEQKSPVQAAGIATETSP